MNSSTSSLLEEAARFHGHLGPYLVLGIKMGLLAKNILKSDPFNMKAEVHTLKRPPYSCIIDGIQIASGCTLGKGNISIQKDQKIYSIFMKDSEKITIIMKPEILESLQDITREELEDYARALFTRKDDELFDVVV